MNTQTLRKAVAMVAGIFMVISLGMAVISPTVVFAATNTATGDIAGVAADLTDSGGFDLITTTLGLTKVAFLTDGTPLTSGAVLPKGTPVHFVIYIDNPTAIPVNDVRIQDVLDTGTFVYQADSMVVDNNAATGSTQAQIYTALQNTGTGVFDATGDGDVASESGGTITIGNIAAGNAQLDIAGSSVWAVRITVQMQ